MSTPTKRHVPLLIGYNKSKASVRGKKKVEVQLTSMIDMFTILVVFLLQSFSADGQIVISKLRGKPGRSRFAALRGRAGKGLRTDQIMALTRGE